jgi:hypothetical protein
MILLVNLIETAASEKPAVLRHDDEFESFAGCKGRKLSFDPGATSVDRQIRPAPRHEWPHLPHGFHCGFVER